MPPRTAPYLSKALQARVEASGRRVAELVELALAIVEGQDQPPARKAGTGDCPHPLARRDRKSGLCNACGTNVSGGKP